MQLKTQRVLIIIIIAIISIIIIAISKNPPLKKEPIKIGLFVTLTGVYPDLGRQIRDGALHAVDELNQKGGINGRQIMLLIKDNRYNFKQAIQNIEELIEEGVVALIGPATSSQAMNLLPIINEKKITTISPTASSSLLAGKDDYLIRMRQSNKEDAQLLGMYAKRIGIKKIAVVYDNTNIAYANDFIDNFKVTFNTSSTIYLIPFDPDISKLRNLSKHIVSFKSDALLIIAELYSSALLIQNVRIFDKNIVILSSPWAKSQRLIEHAGKSSDGVITVDSFDDAYQSDTYQRYRKGFFDRFGYYPGFGADTAYETIFVIKKALETNPNPKRLKDTIMSIGEFEGLQGKFKIDKYGDVTRKPFILKIQDNSFVKDDKQ